MSKAFMNVCVNERTRLLNKIEAAKNVLDIYRQLWKLYCELEAHGEHKATWSAAKSFIAETVSPGLKEELALYQRGLERVTEGQQRGCMEIAAEGGTSE